MDDGGQRQEAAIRIVGLLNWYEEFPSWLSASVASAARLCDHIIAVDGAYALYPGASSKPASGPEQAETILQTAYGLGVGATVHTPDEPWWGNEVQKRDFMFRLGEQITSPYEDWYLVIDADEVLTKVPLGTREQLMETESDVAELTLWQRERNLELAKVVEGSADFYSPLRRLFRVLPDMHIEDAHYVVTGQRGGRKVYLAGNSRDHRLEPAADFWGIELENRSHMRDKGRTADKRTWMRKRDELGIERIKEATGG